jgi:hypothetical protein
MKKLPSDLAIFECIYAMYRDASVEHSREQPIRSTKIYVPIDVELIANKLKTDPYELFGRLYHHIDHKYHYKVDDGSDIESNVHLFALAVGKDKHCINFPYLSAILADYRLEDRRNKWSLWISIISLIVALAAVIAQVAAS